MSNIVGKIKSGLNTIHLIKLDTLLIILCCVFMSFVFHNVAAAAESSLNDIRIDLCEYGSQDLESLSIVVEKEMIGKVGFDIEKFISTPNVYIAVGKKLTSRHHQATGVAVGYRSGARYRCMLKSGNINQCVLGRQQKRNI